ncbi:MAG: hypothetical protein KME17_04410 [Cyanosarcina radialis HA8281-LM2]|nr:hypothetical protein [Cyanosarcina radialis HA8281-LM2]
MVATLPSCIQGAVRAIFRKPFSREQGDRFCNSAKNQEAIALQQSFIKL